MSQPVDKRRALHATVIDLRHSVPRPGSRGTPGALVLLVLQVEQVDGVDRVQQAVGFVDGLDIEFDLTAGVAELS